MPDCRTNLELLFILSFILFSSFDVKSLVHPCLLNIILELGFLKSFKAIYIRLRVNVTTFEHFPEAVVKYFTDKIILAVLAAMAPELAPFMADECLLSMPEVEGIDYTMKEYMKLVEQTKECVDRLNAQGEQI